jgi:hypothetical protein
MDFVGMAESVGKNPFLTSFGVKADYTPASIVEIDGYLDEIYGTTGEIKKNPNWQISKGEMNLIMAVGSYVGEVIRRAFGGQWSYDPKENVVHACIALPGTWRVLPINKVLKRLRNGAEDALHPLYTFAREKCGVPKIDEIASYRSHADDYPSRSHLHDEQKQRIVARLRSHIPTQATPETVGSLAPGTKLAACPKCQRPPVSGKPHCVYCGAALVVPATCGKCQRKNSPSAKACMYCRAPL